MAKDHPYHTPPLLPTDIILPPHHCHAITLPPHHYTHDYHRPPIPMSNFQAKVFGKKFDSNVYHFDFVFLKDLQSYNMVFGQRYSEWSEVVPVTFVKFKKEPIEIDLFAENADWTATCLSPNKIYQIPADGQSVEQCCRIEVQWTGDGKPKQCHYPIILNGALDTPVFQLPLLLPTSSNSVIPVKDADSSVLITDSDETQSASPKTFTESATQFDSAVSMCDLTHRSVVVEEQLFLSKGGNQQYYEWEECGLFLYIPENTISPLSSCEVRVSALAGGDFIFPDDHEIVSAVYAVTFSHSLQHAIVIELQHCVDLQTQKHVDLMSFAVALPLPIPGSYKFIPIKGGRFNVGDRFGSIEASKSLCYCIILRECVLEAGNNGSCGGQSNAYNMKNEQNDHVEDDLSENEEGSGSGQDEGAAGGDGGSENSSSQDDEQPESETNSESKDDEEESDALVEENEVKEKNHQVNDSEDVCQEETMCEDSVGDGSQNQSGEPVMNCEIGNAIDDSESVDIKAVVSCIKEEIHKKSAALKNLFDTSIKAVSANMSVAGLISHAVMKNPSYESIIADVNHHLMFVESLPQILEHCEKFFRALLNLGGPFVRAQKLLQKNIAQSIQEKLHFEMPFRDIEEKAAELTRKPETKQGACIKQWYMCQYFVHEINRAKWDVEVAFAKELNVLKNYLDRKAPRKIDERTIVVFRFSKEYLTIEKPQPVGSDIGWSVVPDLGHPYKICCKAIDKFGQNQPPQPSTSKYQAFSSLKPESDDIFTFSLNINDILTINNADDMGIDLHITVGIAQVGKTQGNDGEVDSPGGSSILDKKPMLHHAVLVLRGHSAEWSIIGLGLGVPSDERDGLRNDTRLSKIDCLEKVIDYWLKKECHTPVTWSELIEILEVLSFTATVRSIREEFLKGKKVLEAYMKT